VDPTVAPGPAMPRHRAINGAPVPRQPRPADTDTAELPALASMRTPHGLPVRSPRAHEFPDRAAGNGRLAPRDPRQVAAALSAYARGIRAARGQHRPPWTHNQGE
jgi:hypothetical protein